jgi:hypothetical protein
MTLFACSAPIMGLSPAKFARLQIAKLDVPHAGILERLLDTLDDERTGVTLGREALSALAQMERVVALKPPLEPG